MRPRPTTALFSVILACAVACGASPDTPASPGGASPASAPSGTLVPDAATGTDASPPPAAALDLPTTAALVGETLCEFHARCFPTYVRDVMPTEASCRERYAAAFRATHFADATFSAADATAMTTCERALGCDALYGGKWQTACRSPRPLDARADGAPCVSDLSCASEACVTAAPAGSCGTCAARVVSGPGAACGEGAKRCAAGLTCLASKRCVAVRALGDTCDLADALCGNGLTCKDGRCAKLPAAGEACDARAGCDPYRLTGCNTAGLCEAVVTLAPNAACEVGALAACGGGQTCAPGDGGAIGTCAPRRRAGEPCRRSQECELFATCTQGACTDPKAPSCARALAPIPD